MQCADAGERPIADAIDVFPFPSSRVVVPRPTAEQLRPGTYLTDGQRLLFVVSQFVAGSELESAVLEDCSTLEVRPYWLDELQELELEPVRRAAEQRLRF